MKMQNPLIPWKAAGKTEGCILLPSKYIKSLTAELIVLCGCAKKCTRRCTCGDNDVLSTGYCKCGGNCTG